MKAQDAEIIFLQLIKDLKQYENKKEKTTFIPINKEANLLSFSINDRYAINRLLAAGFKEKLAVEVSSVLHEISLYTTGNQMNCIVNRFSQYFSHQITLQLVCLHRPSHLLIFLQCPSFE